MECIKPDSFSHIRGYREAKCRCADCRAAAAEYSRNYKKSEAGRKYTREYRSRQYVKDKEREGRLRRDAERKGRLAAYKLSRGCSVCGYKDNPVALDFHHSDGDKEFNLSGCGLGKSWEKIEEELTKCTILCANCHRVEHHGHGTIEA